MAIPTRDALIKQVRDDLAAEGVTQVWIRRTFEAAVATVLGALLWAWYFTVDAIAKQANPATATGLFLDAWCAVYGVTRQAAGTATGTCVLTGNTGATQPAGSVLVGPDGQEYTLDSNTTLEGDEGGDGAAFPTITASGSGDLYNLAVGATLTVVSPASGIDGASSVGTTGITGGQTAEGDDALRVRLLSRIRRPGETGTVTDYDTWAHAASAQVARVWVYPRGRLGTEPGEVLVLFSVAGTNPIPSAGLRTTVDAYLQTKKPAGSHVTTERPTGQAVALSLTLPTASNTDANKALVVAYLREFFATMDPGMTAANLDMRAAAARSALAVTFVAVAGGAGSADAVASGNKHLLYLGTVTWG